MLLSEVDHFSPLDRGHEPTEWTEELIEELRRLHAAGLSYRQIAMRLGRSRSAVCGKARRIGLRG